MAEHPDTDNVQVENDDSDVSENYKRPAEASLDEIRNKDADDESLARYKEKLLGDAIGENPIVFPDDPRKVILSNLTLIAVAGDRENQELDLKQDPAALKKTHLKIKEGTEYKIKTTFHVQREIVAGLKYVQQTYKAGIRVDKSTTMIGSYGPSKDLRECMTKVEVAPKGMISRGSYSIKSAFVDDDDNKYLQWEWSLDIVKDYKD